MHSRTTLSPSSSVRFQDSPAWRGNWTPKSGPEWPAFHSPFEKFAHSPETSESGPIGHWGAVSQPCSSQEMNPILQTHESKENRRIGLATRPSKKAQRRSCPAKTGHSSPFTTIVQLDCAKNKVGQLTQHHNDLRRRLGSAIQEEEKSSTKISVMEEQIKELKRLKAEEIERLIVAVEQAEEQSQQDLLAREAELKRLDKRLVRTGRSTESIIAARTQIAIQTQHLIRGTEEVHRELQHIKSGDRHLQREINALKRQLADKQAAHDEKLAAAQSESEGYRHALQTLEAQHKDREGSLQAQADQMRARQMGPRQEEKHLLMEQRILLLESEAESLRATLDEGRLSAQRALERKQETAEEVKALKKEIERIFKDGKAHLVEREAEVELAMRQLAEIMSGRKENRSPGPPGAQV